MLILNSCNLYDPLKNKEKNLSPQIWDSLKNCSIPTQITFAQVGKYDCHMINFVNLVHIFFNS